MPSGPKHRKVSLTRAQRRAWKQRASAASPNTRAVTHVHSILAHLKAHLG